MLMNWCQIVFLYVNICIIHIHYIGRFIQFKLNFLYWDNLSFKLLPYYVLDPIAVDYWP